MSFSNDMRNFFWTPYKGPREAFFYLAAPVYFPIRISLEAVKLFLETLTLIPEILGHLINSIRCTTMAYSEGDLYDAKQEVMEAGSKILEIPLNLLLCTISLLVAAVSPLLGAISILTRGFKTGVDLVANFTTSSDNEYQHPPQYGSPL